MRRLIGWMLASAVSLTLLGTPLAVAAGGCVNQSLANDATASTVSIKDCAFAPTITRVAAGATVSWKNVDKLPHVVSGVGWGSVSGYASTDGSMLQPGGTFSHIFTTSGLYPYACYLHPGMSGVVVVGDADTGPAVSAMAAPASAAPNPAASAASSATDAPWSYLLIALFGALAIGGYVIALARHL